MSNLWSDWKLTMERQAVAGQAKVRPSEGYCKHDAQDVKKCLPSMSPFRVHIQLTHLSWPVLTTHSEARLKIIADTRFWWAVGTERESLRPSGRNVTFRIKSRGVRTEADLCHLGGLETHSLNSPITEMADCEESSDHLPHPIHYQTSQRPAPASGQGRRSRNTNH